jgi:septal ring-binding cell division protein DamX
MAYGGKRGGAGERVLEGRHVIGLFFLMLLFSGVFFTLGYVMGRNQYDGQVRAAPNTHGPGYGDVAPKPDVAVKHKTDPALPDAIPDTTSDSGTPPSSDWEFYHTRDSKPVDDHLKPAPAAKTVAAKNNGSSKAPGISSKASPNPAAVSGGSYLLQVAALKKEADALDLARQLQKKKFPAFVLSPQGDKYYRVQVGPYADAKTAETAKKGLEGAGFKAIVKH